MSVEGIRHYLESFKFPFLRTKLTPPSRLRLRVRLHAALKLVNLLPSMVELFPHLDEFLREPALDVLASLVNVELNLA
jgi:hypothetical protein